MDVVTCEKHGLRYNRAVESGCVRCRRERGAGTRSGTTSGRGPVAARAEAPASLPMQLLIAALLVGGTGSLCWGAHQAVIDSFAGGLIAHTGRSGIEAATAPGEAYGDDKAEPAAWPPPRPVGPTPTIPPGMRGHGPAEQQKQIEELFRQMKEDEAKERGEDPNAGEEPQ